MNNIIDLWHGGRGLESSYKSFKTSRSKKWEHGPGLYLTTHYLRALSYAKGGGKTYSVQLEIGNNISDIEIKLDDVIEFIAKNVISTKRKAILNDIEENMRRLNLIDTIHAETLLNLIINYEAISLTKTQHLNQFLVQNNVDFGLVKNYGGRDETVVVVYNLNKIKKVTPIPAKDVVLEEYVKAFPTINRKKQLSI